LTKIGVPYEEIDFSAIKNWHFLILAMFSPRPDKVVKRNFADFADFGAKNGPRRPPRGPPFNAVNTEKFSFWCLVMVAAANLVDVSKKLILGQISPGGFPIARRATVSTKTSCLFVAQS